MGTRSNVQKSWVDEGRFLEESYWYRYFTSYHWAITQVTPASMEVQPTEEGERLFVVTVDILGLIGFSSFVSTVTATMTQLRQLQVSRHKEISQVKTFFGN